MANNQPAQEAVEQADSLGTLDDQIKATRQRIAALQHELASLERQRRGRVARPARRRLLALAAMLAIAYAAQLALGRVERGGPSEALVQALAGGALLVAALAFGARAGRSGSGRARLDLPREVPAIRCSGLAWKGAWTIAALLAAGLAASLFALAGENRTVILSWLAGMAALLIAQLWGTRLRWPRLSAAERPFLFGLAAVVLATLASRAYRLTLLPYNLDGDFADVGLQARALVSGQQTQIFTYGWADVPILGYIPPWLTMAFLGDGLLGLSASGVVEGLLIILGVYLLGRDLFHPRVGLLAAALLAASYTHLAASRTSSYIDPVLFLVYAIYFLLLGLREARRWVIVASGILTALCVQMYYSGRIVVFLVGFLALFLLLFRRAWLWSRWRVFLLWGLAVLIALGPMLVVFARSWDDFMSRTRAVFILAPDNITHQSGVFGVDTIPALMAQQLRHATLMFFYYADTSTQFNLHMPFLDTFSAPLFALGFGYALLHPRRVGHALLLGWVALVIVVGCLLTINPPFWPRLIVLLPPTALLAALALDRSYNLLRAALRRRRRLASLLGPALAAVIAVSGVLNWNAYVASQATNATPRARIARYLTSQPLSVPTYLISNEFQHGDREFAFLAPNHLAANIPTNHAVDQIAALGGPTLVILSADQALLAGQLRELFPSGTLEAHQGDADSIAFYAFHLP
jgi:4-amino-4-deoxy-L-arabinose transferase-like glycosyltransferase